MFAQRSNSLYRFAACLLIASWVASLGTVVVGQEGTPDEELVRQQKIVDRFISVLEKNPRRGTALDRVYGAYVETGTLDQLVKRYQDRAKDPKDTSAWMILGLIESQRGRDAAAVEAFTKAATANPKEAIPSYYLGQSLVLVGQPEQAVAAFEEAIRRKPAQNDLLEIFQALGRVHQRAQHGKEALEVWSRLEKLFPGDARVQEQIAAALVEDGQHALALPRYEALLKLTKDDYRKAVYKIEAAELKVKLNRSQEATADLEKLLSTLNPTSWLHREVRRKIEEVYLRTEDQDGLAKYYQGWLVKNPEDVDAMARLARLLARQARVPEAQVWLDKALKLAPSRKELRQTFIQQLIEDQRYPDAIAQYELLDKADPNNPDFLREWGKLILRDTSKPKEERVKAAEVVWRRLLAARPKDPLIATQVADLFRHAEMTQPALDLYLKAVELAPDQPQYLEYLGEYYHQLKRTDEALSTWRKTIAGKKRTAESLARLAEVLSSFGYLQQAIPEIQAACELDPKDFSLQLKAADLFAKAEKYPEALAALSKSEKLAQNVEESEAVLASQLKIYQLEDSLTKRTEELAAQLAKGTPTAKQHFLLARYYEALRQYPEATRAIDASLKLEPQAVPALGSAARIYENAGDLKSAADLNRKLAVIDRRGRSDYLKYVAQLETQLGRIDEALKAGKELIASAPGNTENYEFYANLCFRLGKSDEGLDSLRRAMRVSPNDPKLILVLAEALAGQYRTDEAIELYWQAFDKSPALDDRLGQTQKLTDLYMQTNHFDKLLERLERFRRDAEDKREMTICLSQAYSSAGDFGMARQELESLLSDNSRDTQLLAQLSKLSLTEGDLTSAVKYQEQLARIAPGPETEYPLATLLAQTGAAQESAAILVRLTSKEEDLEKFLKNLDALLASGQHDTALLITEARLREEPKNWELLYREGVALAKAKPQEALKRFQAILDLPNEETEWCIAEKNRRAKAAKSKTPTSTSQQVMYETARLDSHYQIRIAVGLYSEEAYYGQRQTVLWSPINFAQVRFAAIGWFYRFAQEAKKDHEFVASYQTAANKSNATPRAYWDWIYALTMQNAESRNYWSVPEIMTAGKKLAAQGDAAGQYLFLNSIRMRASQSGRGQTDNLPPLPNEDLDLAISSYRGLAKKWNAAPGSGSSPSTYMVNAVLKELRRAGRVQDEQKLFEELVGKVQSNEEIAQAITLTASREDLPGTLVLFDKWAKNALQSSTKTSPVAAQSRSLLNSLCPLMGLSGAAKKDAEVLNLLDRGMDFNAARATQERLRSAGRPKRAASNSPYSYYTVYYGKTPTSARFSFPSPGEYFDQGVIALLRNAYEIFLRNDNLSDLQKHLAQRLEKAVAGDKVYGHLALAYLAAWSDDKEASLSEMSAAAELVPQDWQLRMDVARLHTEMQNFDEALTLVNAINPLDQDAMRERETMALNLAVRLGDHERATQAAERLFGLRLDAETQVQLASQMRRLGMNQQAEAVLSRAQRQAGSRLSAMTVLMNANQAEGRTDVAAQIAYQILRRSRPQAGGSSRYSPMTADDGSRVSALQVLAASGKVKEMIAATEEQLNRSPQAGQLITALAELYEAAGDVAKALALQAKMVEQKPDDANLRYRYAQKLAATERTADACEQFKICIKQQPQLLGNDYYSIRQVFRQAKKDAELSALLQEIDLRRVGQYYYVIELASALIQDPQQRPSGLALLKRTMEAYPQSRTYMLDNLYDRGIWELPEIYEFGKQALVPKTTDVESDPWFGLSQIRSYNSDGRTNSVFSHVLEAAATRNDLPKLRESLSAAVAANPGWKAGTLMIAAVDARLGKAVEARQVLEAALAVKDPLDFPASARWMVGQEIEASPQLKELAIKVYEGAMSAESPVMNSNGFEYSPGPRLLKLYAEAGRKEDARKLMVKAEKPIPYDSDPDYAAYRRVYNLAQLAKQYEEMDAPTEALRLYREMLTNPTLNNPANQNYSSIEYRLREARQQLDRLLPKMAEAQTPEMVRSLLAASTDPAKPAIDLMLAVQNTPTDIPKIDSQLAILLGSEKLSSQSRETALKQLAELAAKHPDDLSVRITATLLALRSGNAKEAVGAVNELKALVEKSPLEELPAGQRANARQREAALRQVALWLVAAECLKQESLRKDGEFLLTRALAAAGRQIDNRYSVAMLYSRSQDALKAGDKKQAEEHLSKILAIALTRPQVKKMSSVQPVGVPMPLPRPIPPEPAAPTKGAAKPPAAPAGNPAAPPANVVAPITLSQFKLAMTVIHLAAENDMPELAMRGVQDALSGGLPVPDTVPSVGGRGMPTPIRRSTMIQGGPGNEITVPVGRELTKLSATWRGKKYSALQMYETLLGIVLPPARAGEIQLYEESMGSWEDGRSLGRELATWAPVAKREEHLKQAVATRRTQPAAILAGDVLLVMLALETKDTPAAKASLGSIAAQLKTQNSVFPATQAIHAAGRALTTPGLEGEALPIVEAAYAVMGKNPYQAQVGLPLLSRHYVSHKRREELKKLYDSYFVTRQAYYAEYGDGAPHQQKSDLIQAATAAAELRDLPLVLDYLGRAADIPGVPDYYETPFGNSLVFLNQQVSPMPPAERYALLRDWTLPAEKRRTIRFAAAFYLPPQTPASILALDLQASPPAAAGLVSTLSLLVEAAAKAGKLGELQAAANAAVAEKLVHAQTLAAMVSLARGDAGSAAKLQDFATATKTRMKSRADALAAAANSPNNRFPQSRSQQVDYSWDDLLVLEAALELPATRSAARSFSRSVLQESRNLAQFEKTAHLSRLMADDAIRDLAPAEKETLKSPGLRHWHSGSGEAANRRYPAAWWAAHEGQLAHITGNGYDSLFFKYPLTGTFEFDFEVHSYDFSQGEVAFGGIVSSPQFWQSNATIFAVGQADFVSRGGAVEARDHWNRYGVKVSPQSIRFHSNGHLVFEETEPSQTSPWLHLVCYDHRRTNFRKLRLTGEPVIPREVKLVEGERMEGWLSPASDPLPKRLAQREPVSRAIDDPFAQVREQPPLQWHAEKGILVGRLDPSSPANMPSHLLYHRPLQSGDKLRYQFLYEPGKTLVHPALGELALLLETGGVSLHWIGDMNESLTGLDKAHAVVEPQHRRGPAKLPLKEGDWNDLEISLTDRIAAVRLNGELVFERPMEKTNSLQPGLFHYREQTAAQVRNIVLTGNWPEKLTPEDLANLLVPAADKEPPQLARARHLLMREDELVEDAADVWQAARSLPAEESYKLLWAWVLPNDQHPTFRLQAGFTASQIASPAIELVRVAAELKRLPELEAAVAAGAKVAEVSGRDVVAMQTLIAAARSDDAAAAGYFKLLEEGLKSLSPDTPVFLRYPELVAVEGTLARPALYKEAHSLAEALVVNQQTNYLTLDWEKRVRALRAKARWLATAQAGAALYQPPKGMTQWTPVSFPTAESRGRGYSPATWRFEKGKAEFFTGSGGDSLYFRSPLQGDFEVHFRRTTFGWKEIRMMYAASAIDLGGDGLSTWRFPLARAGSQTPLAAKLPNWAETADCKIIVKDGDYRVIVNGIVVHTERLGPHSDPWLAIQTKEPHFDGRVENVQILGKPVVPDVLQLSAGPTLLSWRADSYGETVDDQAAAWAKDQTEIVGRLHQNAPGSKRESLLQYHRPLLEDGEIEYEFYYEAGKTLVHPALGRTAFLLAPDGVRSHKLTDGAYEQSGLAPDNEATLEGSATKVPLADKAWNKVKLSLAGDVVTITLAGEKIGQHKLTAGESRLFGLFRYSDATTARVRNVTYRGNWPKIVPSLEEQELALSK